MFRPMRRKMQQLDIREAEAMLDRASSGTLALIGDDGYPYAVPLSFVREGSRIYFHGAKSGHKFDAISAQPKASFCVVDADAVVPEEYTTRYRSAIAFGKVRVLEDETEIMHAASVLAEKYNGAESAQKREEYIKASKAALCMFELEIEHLTGKESAALARQRREANGG